MQMTFDEIVERGKVYEAGFAAGMDGADIPRGRFHAEQTALEACHTRRGGVKEYAERVGLNCRHCRQFSAPRFANQR